MQPNKAKIMLVASFYADSYALPFHFHSADSVQARLPECGHSLTPPCGWPFQRVKYSGDLTHIGDQSLLMYQLLQQDAGFTIETARKRWCQYMQKYSGFIDKASLVALATYKKHPHALTGSNSNDMAGAARIAPFVYFINDFAALLIAVEAQTRLTHNHPTVVAAALYLTKLAYRIKHGQDIASAIDAESAALPSASPLAPLIDAAQQLGDLDTADAIIALGADGKVSSAFAATMLLLFRYQNDYWRALKNNVLAGGDTATRAALAGVILGARLKTLPSEFRALRCYSHIIEGAPRIRAH